jgi:hypothetical protein
MVKERFSTWQGLLAPSVLDELIERVFLAVLIGQRAGDFTLGRRLDGGVAAWPSGRCFNEALELRWWPTAEEDQRNVLIVDQLPEGWQAPEGWEQIHPLAEPPVETRYLCIGHYDDRSAEGVHLWWESRYGRAFEYLGSAPPAARAPKKHGRGYADGHGRVYLCAKLYELEDGRTQHRLMRFEHGGLEEERS